MSGHEKGVAFGIVGAVIGILIPPGNVYGAIALGAAGYQAGESMDAADRSVEAAKKQQDISNNQANEVMERASENTKAIMNDALTFKGNQEGAFVKGGVAVNSESSLLDMEQAHANFTKQAFLESRDASLQSNRIKAQAQNNVDAAEQYRQAAQIQAGMSVLGSAASVYGASNKGPSSQAPNGNYGDGYNASWRYSGGSGKYATP